MTTYSITLDDVDLALLPPRTHSYNNFLKKELYQFQVIKSAPEPTALYTCHICAVEVPVAFANEHAASVKHRANVRIASVAAERMRAHISALPPPHTAQPSTRFCENCSTEMDEGHEKTKEHRAAVVLDGLLWDLMKAYVHDDDESKYNLDQYEKDKWDDLHFKNKNGDDNNNLINQGINNIEPKNEEAEGTDEGETIKERCETDTEEYSEDGDNESATETESNESINIELPKKVSKNIMTEQGTNVNWVEHYEEELCQLINGNDYFEYKETTIINIKLNEYTLSDMESNKFHSYEKIKSSDNVKCIVCDFVLDYQEAEIHKYDFEHMRRIARFGKYGHFVREIDNFYSHCILCNEKLKNVDVTPHIQSLIHNFQELRYTNTLVINKAKTNRTTEDNHTENNAISYDTANKTINAQNSPDTSTKHTNNNTIDAQNPTDNATQIEYPFEVTATGNVRCLVCECQVPRGLNNREQHVKGLRHRTEVLRKKRTTKPIENKYGEELRKFIDDRLFFEFKEITWDTFRLQLDDNILEAYTIRFHSFYPVDNHRLKCQVCDCVFRCENEEEHTYDSNHLRTVAKLGNDGHFVRKINRLYSHCILCNDVMLNRNVAKHKRSNGHMEVKTLLVKSAAGSDSE